MDNFDEIRDALDEHDDDGEAGENPDSGRITIVGTDPNASMEVRMATLMSENAEMKRRLDGIEAMVKSMYTHLCEAPERSRLEIPDPDMLRNVGSNSRINLDGTMDESEGADSYVDVDAASVGSAFSSATGLQRMKMNVAPSRSPALSMDPISITNPMTMPFKSNSATAAEGYTSSPSLWGTALASMLIAALRYYITKRDATMLMIDEIRVMKTYVRIAPTLYESITRRGLPKVTDPVTRYLSKSIPRMNKNEVPTSTADGWNAMNKSQDGRDVLAVLKTMIVAAQSTPEAMVHPISQIIPFLDPKVIMEVNGSTIFTINRGVAVNPIPNDTGAWA
ncbi:hypothetical protein B0J12DRAFT_747795 [Macrophomina phaseolina]|uniref:Uncharacterized protein n=1 Tax=Macrophomina phaseolina TaxID=35725 RepID=A0ABQ8FPA8_9PEZI|nr:hypothetical protein B0J12DRAFT_747795 [Macrophomina phaseolina]